MFVMHTEESVMNFRDKISTIDQQGRRIWIYPKKPSGRLTSARGMVSILLLAFMFLAPLIKIDGQPLLLFDVLQLLSVKLDKKDLQLIQVLLY